MKSRIAGFLYTIMNYNSLISILTGKSTDTPVSGHELSFEFQTNGTNS